MASLCPRVGFLFERLQIWEPPIQALQGQGPELKLGELEPTARLGRLVDRQTRGEPAGLLRREGLLERANPLRLEVGTAQTDTFSRRITGVQEVWHLSGPVHSRRLLSDTHRTHTTQRRCAPAEVGGAVPLVRIVVARGFPRFRWQRLPDFPN